jgi:crossover junction endodeoxyribonuclease RuvC
LNGKVSSGRAGAPPCLRVVGIDPGTVVTGWGVVEAVGSKMVHLAHGTIATAGAHEQGDRLSRIYHDIEAVIEVYQPDGICIERIFFARNAQSALKLGQARGVVLLAAAHHHTTVYEYAAAEIKSAVVGYGQATKGQVQMMVASLLRLSARPEVDAADALAAAICHLHRQVFQVRLAEAMPKKLVAMRQRRSFVR